ncbi:hypothetical protein ACFVYP_14765 [Kitasatospora sp. NPDC058201]
MMLIITGQTAANHDEFAELALGVDEQCLPGSLARARSSARPG